MEATLLQALGVLNARQIAQRVPLTERPPILRREPETGFSDSNKPRNKGIFKP